MKTNSPDPNSRKKKQTSDNSNSTAPKGNRLPTTVSRAEVEAGKGPSSTLEAQTRPVPLRRGMSSLRHRDFRLFWIGQIVSLIGTWMQIVAQSWLVLELTNSAFVLGVVGALQFLPMLTLAVLGGVLADRLPRRQILLATQFTSAMLALVLAVLTAANIVNIGHVVILALLLGIVNAVDMPTRQAFVVELVGVEDLGNAIALNSAAFNAARLVGPAVAGLAIGWIGLAGCFYLNALSFLAVIAGLIAMKAGSRAPARVTQGASIIDDLREGFAYAAHNPQVRLIVLLVAVVGTFGMNFNVLVPLLARDVLQSGASGYGLLTSAMGGGSFVAAMALAYQRKAPQSRMLLGAVAALGLLEMILAWVSQFFPAALLLAGLGMAMIVFTTISNTMLQTATPNALRGRVMSLYTAVFVGTTPIGNPITGAMAESWGVGMPFLIGGLISLLAAVWGYRTRPTLTRSG